MVQLAAVLGELVQHARVQVGSHAPMVDDGALKVTSAAEAVRTGRIVIDGRPADLELFARLFRITAAPSPQEGIVVH
ncbi:hypothetical protein [Amycolatopsis plumensis]|uniref:Uncharacterized protein n=1 Tax=Amycolatopsis plumensis TaxID=236508 RepID=A0ABV5UAU1_9PSEU